MQREYRQDAISNSNNVFQFSVASSTPYQRVDSKGNAYNEVLEISENAINFERLIDERCPFIFEHEHDKQLGVVEKAYIADGKLYVDVKFSETEFAQNILKDIISGVRRNVSIGYSVEKYEMIKNPGEAIPTMLVTSWTPYECTSCSCPADPTVGFQRSLDIKEDNNMKKEKEEDKPIEEVPANEPNTENKAVDGDEKPVEGVEGTGECNKEAVPEEKPVEETKAVEEQPEEKPVDENKPDEDKPNEEEEIRALGEIVDKKELAEEFIKNKRSYAEFKQALKTKKDNVIKDKKMEKKFSLRKAILNATGKMSDEEAAFERNVIAENKRKFNANDADIVISKRDIFDGVIDAALINTQYRPDLYAENLRFPNAINQTGTKEIAVNGNSISFAVATSGINAGYVALNGDIPSADMAFTQQTLSPKKYGAFTTVSYQSLLQDDPEIENIIMTDMIKALDAAKDNAFFNGASANNEPVGLYNISGVNTVSISGTPTLSTALEFEKKIRESGDGAMDLKWVMGTDSYYTWKSTPKSATEQNDFLIDDNNKCIGYPVIISTAVPTSGVVLGNWNEALEANFDGISLKIVEDAALSRRQAVEIQSFGANDYCFRRPSSFTKGI